jgi:hypothetical protein
MKPNIKYCKSGIIKAIVNTTERWANYYITWDDCPIVEVTDGDGFISESFLVEVEFADGVRYTRIEQQEKDQIILYFIPFNLLEG